MSDRFGRDTAHVSLLIGSLSLSVDLHQFRTLSARLSLIACPSSPDTQTIGFDAFNVSLASYASRTKPKMMPDCVPPQSPP
jgi:hypothetical protein